MPDAQPPGPVILFGSGETSPVGGRIFETAVARLAQAAPPRLAILETPAGFELNSAQVAGRVATFLRQRLQNYHPEIEVVPARKRGTPFSPDDPDLTRPLLHANLIFLGPGSPTYTVRQLQDSLAWHTLIARHRLGATIAMASAAVVAAGTQTLPVYEIYKAGADLYWHSGLDFFGAYGLPLVFIPHWNNADGGADLDTRRCFMGETRFNELRRLLPANLTIVGIDELTALTIDLAAGQCRVEGSGEVTIIRNGQEQHFVEQQTFALADLGPFHTPELPAGIPSTVWETVVAAQAPDESPPAPPEVLALVEERQTARAASHWAQADDLRRRISMLGWKVVDTPAGPSLEAE